MTTAHPDPDTLVEYAAGGLKTGARLVLGVHLKTCAACRREVGRLEAVGGALLQAEPQAALAPDALDRAMASLDRTAEPQRVTLKEMTRGFWTPIGAGAALKPLSRIADPGEKLYLIRAEGGRGMPEHGHTGKERLVVITGAFQDDQGRYGPGDLVERGPEDRHQPVACEGETCLCLSATEGPVKLAGLARLAQIFLRI
ncbi:MAG TPA: cupin domain-containing protein [Caulobacteraceae bacterium]|jgi:putative transcriptional regulator